MKPALVVLLCLTGCDINAPGLHVVPPKLPIAVGAFGGAGVVRCDAVKVTKYEDGCQGVRVERYELDDPSIFEVVEGKGLLALKEGETGVTMHVAGGRSLRAQLIAKDIDKVTISDLGPTGPCSAAGALIMPAGHLRRIYVSIGGDGEVLGGKVDFATVLKTNEDGLIATATSSSPTDPISREVSLTLRSTPGEVTLTSPFDPSLDLKLTAYGFADIQRYELISARPLPWPPPSMGNGGRYDLFEVSALPVVKGEVTCGDNEKKLVRTRTPEVCKILDETQTPNRVLEGSFYGSRFKVWPIDGGSCEVGLSLSDGGFPSVGQFAVSPP
jgi:hypothetical protein